MSPFDRSAAITGEWECMECGYIEEGTQARRPAKCPECGAPANALEFFSYEDEEEDWDSEGLSDDEDFEDEELDVLEDEGWDDDER